MKIKKLRADYRLHIYARTGVAFFTPIIRILLLFRAYSVNCSMIKIPRAGYLAFFALLSGLMGCGNDSRSGNKNEPSNTDLLAAMGGLYFRVKIPTDLDPATHSINIALRKSDGSIQDFAGSGIDADSLGKTVKVFYFEDRDDDKPKCTVIFPHATLSKTLSISSETSRYSTNGKLYEMGEKLIRFSGDGSIKAGETPQEDDFDLIIYAKKRGGEQPAPKPQAPKPNGDLDPFPE